MNYNNTLQFKCTKISFIRNIFRNENMSNSFEMENKLVDNVEFHLMLLEPSPAKPELLC